MKLKLPKILTRKFLVISVAALLLYALAGFVALPALVRWYVPRYAHQDLHCQADLQKIRINPFLLTVEINGFSLKQADGSPLVAFARLFVDLETSSLFRWAVVLREFALDKPEIHLAVEPDGTINFEKLAPASSTPPEPAKPDARLLRFILQGAAINEGRIVAVDNRQSTPAQLSLEKLNLQIKDLSSLKEHNGSYAISAATENGESLQWEGGVTLTPLRSEGSLRLTGIRTASLWQFVKDNTNLEQPTGQITITTGYHLDGASSPMQMTLDGLRISLSELSLQLLHAEKAFLQLKKVDLDAPHFDLTTRKLQIGKLLVEEGAVDVRINETGGLNLQRIVRAAEPAKQNRQALSAPAAPPAQSVAGAAEKTSSPPPPKVVVSSAPAPADPPFRMNVDAIEVKDVSLALDDKSRKTPIEAGIGGINLSLKAQVEAGAQGNKVSLQEISSELQAVAIRSALAPEPLFTTEKLTVEGGECDLDARALKVARIALHTGRLDAGRDADGTLNWLRALETKGAAEKSPGAAKPATDAGPAWKFLVKSFELDGFSSRFSDLTTASDKPVLSLQGFKAKLADIDGKSPMAFTLGFQMEQGGTATVNGTVNPAIPSVEADINIAGLVLTSLQPYIEPYVTLTIESAAVSTRGKMRYGVPGAASSIAYAGDFSLNDLSLTNPGVKTPYLSWDAVQLPKATLTLQPNGLEIEDIKIVKPVGELIIGEDKTLNLAKILKKQQGGTAPPPAAKPEQNNDQAPFPYKISRVQVEKGNMIFADLSLRPQFKTRIHDLKGTITGLSSTENTQAKIKMAGRVDRYGMAKISGVIRPNDFGRSSDIAMVFQNVEMKNLSPYSGKFAGRLIKSGKVSADFKYVIHDYKMVGDNKILIDNLMLGEQVDDPDAANLPLDLAIALLQDADGRINIGLPVTGDLKDPQFSIGPLVWKAFTNLITKAVTAPFRALGSLFGGEDINFDAVVFDPGSAELLPPEKEKLLKLADALKSRPQLKLVIQGRYSPDADGRELKDLSIRRLVAARQGEKLGPDEDPGSLDFTNSRTQNILEDLYRERFGKASLGELEKGIATGSVKPRTPATNQQKKGNQKGVFTKMVDNLGLYKIVPGGKSSEQAALWAGELSIRLAESEKITDQTFLQLAGKRTQAIAGELEGKAKISKERIGVKDPEPLADNGAPSAKLSLDAI
ncbi:DUF748 domain-containing protein [Desulfopila sp. IMCC35006]|uniref:DUF748 domain-containing protein n=1 Tax=Desulfopila sp. IMCC35006 TaxID=2569542 RepID=UPI0010ABE741|nr:DUF748 domain-containing protein [Desulfopila sp. IMCC35006]TKB25659.1 DUF748 domain-containing protein [Desulfopila sp. IMCC35006]